MDFIRSLRTHLATPGDFTDSSLRDRQIKIVGDYAITDCVDVPVRIVMVVDVCPAGD
jgi:hypothetical protein